MTDHIEQHEDYVVCIRSDDRQIDVKLWFILEKIQIALLTIGLALGAIYVAVRMESYFSSRAALQRFESAEPEIAAQETSSPAEATRAVEPDFSGWGEGRIHAYQKSAKQREGVPMAVLQIQKVHIEAPVFDGTDDLTLNHAVGRIAGTAKPGERGNIGIAGHRDGFFRGLKDIKAGDQIELKVQSRTDIYTVDHIQIVSPRDVSVLRTQDGPALTLVTCYPFYFVGSAPQRFVVTAYLTQHSPVGSTTSEARLNPQRTNQTLEEQ